MIVIYLIAIPLIGHGLAHLSGVFAPWSNGAQGFTDAAWLFSNGVTFHSVFSRIYSLVWLAATAGLVLAGVEVILRQKNWIPIAIAGCLLSLAAIVPWWRAVPPGAKVGVAFDLILLVLLLSPLGAKIAQMI